MCDISRLSYFGSASTSSEEMVKRHSVLLLWGLGDSTSSEGKKLDFYCTQFLTVSVTRNLHCVALCIS